MRLGRRPKLTYQENCWLRGRAVGVIEAGSGLLPHRVNRTVGRGVTFVEREERGVTRRRRAPRSPRSGGREYARHGELGPVDPGLEAQARITRALPEDEQILTAEFILNQSFSDG